VVLLLVTYSSFVHVVSASLSLKMGLSSTKNRCNISLMMFLVDYKLSVIISLSCEFICHSFTQSDFSTNFRAGKNQQSNRGEAFSKFDSEKTPPINKALLDSTYIVNVISLSEKREISSQFCCFHVKLAIFRGLFFFGWPCLAFFRTGAMFFFTQALLFEHIRNS